MSDAQNTAREALISVSATALSEFLEWSSCARDRMDHDGKQKWRDAKVSLAAALSAAQAPTQQTGVRSYTLPLDPTAAPGASWTEEQLTSAWWSGVRAGNSLGDGPSNARALTAMRAALATLNAAPPPQISEPVEGVRKALQACADRLEWYLNGIGLEHDHPGEVALDNARQALAALSRGEGAEPVPATIYKAVERVLDENSAWIARPSKDVTEKVALAAGIAWQQYTSHHPEAGAPSQWPGSDWRCPECHCRGFARVNALQADGRYRPGPDIRCVHCKQVFSPPVPALKASDLEREGVAPIIHRCVLNCTEEEAYRAADEVIAFLSSRPAAQEDHTPRAVPLSTISEGWRELAAEAWGALNFILAFYEPGQRYLDTNAWKNAEAGGRRVHAKLRAFLDAAPPAPTLSTEGGES